MDRGATFQTAHSPGGLMLAAASLHRFLHEVACASLCHGDSVLRASVPRETVEIASSLRLGLKTDPSLLPYSVVQATPELWEPRF